MLSSQTKDTVTAATMRTLNASLPGGLTLASILAIPAAELNTLITPIGFHNLKTQYIKRTAAILQSDFASDIPSTYAGLISLPGIGPKMAHLTLSAAWGRTEGIGVDVHVHRITNLWGWHKTRTPEETRRMLEAWLPRERWREINTLLVGFGQMVCLPVGRRCGSCEVGRRGLCPSAVVEKRKRAVWVAVGKEGKGVESVIVEEEEKTAGGGEVVREKRMGGNKVGEGLVVKEEEVLEGGEYVLDGGEERVKVEDVEG